MHTTCHGQAALIERITVLVKHRARVELVVVARGALDVRTGAKRSITLRLTSAGKKDLAGARRHPVTVELLVTITGGHTERLNVRIT
jgi:hypothetical protein